MNDLKTLHESITQIDIKGIADLAHVELVDEIAHFPYTDPNNYSKVGFPKKAAHDYSKDYLTFEITNDGNITWSLYDYDEDEDKDVYTDANKTIYYKKNDDEWTEMPRTLSVVSGDVVQFKGDNAQYGSSASLFNSFCEATTAGFILKGNIMSLVDSTGFTTATILVSDYTFVSLFQECIGLTSAENLVLPATTLTSHCYEYMLADCTSLTQAPELPAVTLAESCYTGMFDYCEGLIKAPELPATALVSDCYSYMFRGCTNLNYVKCLATDIPASDCTTSWLIDVAPTGTFVGDPTSTWQLGEDGIPGGWTTNTNTGGLR